MVDGNDGDPTGTTIGEKVLSNRRYYGHGGVQHDLAAAYAGAVRRGEPVSVSTDFTNAGARRCEIWLTATPVAGADGEEVERLLCVALIKPIVFN